MPPFEGEPGSTSPMKSPRNRVLSVLGGMLFWPLFLVAFGGTPSCMGFGEPALAAVNACPAATALLGAPVSQSWMGISCGNAETEDDDGEASWRMPVAGPSGHGTLEIEGVERSGRWQFRSLLLSAGGRTIDVVSCAAGGSGERVAITHREIAGTIATVVGEAGVASGTTCTVTIDPSDGAPTCRLGVVCGERTLYGGGSQGYGTCTSGAGGAIVMRDASASSVDGDPMLDLEAHQIVITDQASAGTWVVTIALP